jgi:hypothetical protein
MTSITFSGSSNNSNLVLGSTGASIDANNLEDNQTLQELKHVQQMTTFGTSYCQVIDMGLQYFDEYLTSGVGEESRLANMKVWPNDDIHSINRVGAGSRMLNGDVTGKVTLSVFDSATSSTSLVINPASDQLFRVLNNTYLNSEPFAFNPTITLADLDLEQATSGAARFGIWYGGAWWYMGKSAVFHPISVAAYTGDIVHEGIHYDGVAYGKAPCKHLNAFEGATSLGIAGGDSWTALIAWTWFFKIIDGNMTMTYFVQNSFWGEDMEYIILGTASKINSALNHYNLPLLLENVSLPTGPIILPIEIVGTYSGFDIADLSNVAYAKFESNGQASFWNSSNGVQLPPYYNGKINTVSKNGDYIIAIEEGSGGWYVEHLNYWKPDVITSIKQWLIIYVFNTVNNTYQTIYTYEDIVGAVDPSGIITFLTQPWLYYDPNIVAGNTPGTISKGTGTKQNITIPWQKIV